VHVVVQPLNHTHISPSIYLQIARKHDQRRGVSPYTAPEGEAAEELDHNIHITGVPAADLLDKGSSRKAEK
jgi:hypothetical protein